MLKMSIRRKLFLAFALVAAISSAALLLLAGSYIRSVRAELDRHFLEDARAALNRQNQAAEHNEEQLLDVVSDVALERDILAPTYASDSQLAGFFDHVPALVQLAVWDSDRQELVRAMVRTGAGVQPLNNANAAALLTGPQKFRHPGVGTFGHHIVIQNERQFPIANIGSNEKPRGTIIGEEDSKRLFGAISFGHEGQALLVDFKSGRLWLAPDEAARASESLPGLERLLAQRPAHGETADVDDGRGRRYRIYTAVSGEESWLALNDGVEAVALMPLDELHAPLVRIRLRVLASVVATLVLALLAALLLSGRFVADIERIRRAVAAFAQGDWRRLEKSSRDELGGALVDSINDMAAAVAERMRRDEAASWRSLVRVVSHEINNTLAPIRSVAATLRSGLQKRLRENDPGSDVDMALQLIVERVDALATFIDGYAEVAKLPPPDRRPADVHRLVAGATALFAEAAEGCGVALDVNAAGSGSAEIDAQQMERVLVNLIKNAIEAAPRGSAVIVSATRVAGSLEISVTDEGPGISPEARRNLFVPYFTTKPGGSGIGLALARQIVVAHGGTITAERGPSGGTLMRVLVPDVARVHPYRELR